MEAEDSYTELYDYLLRLYKYTALNSLLAIIARGKSNKNQMASLKLTYNKMKGEAYKQHNINLDDCLAVLEWVHENTTYQGRQGSFVNRIYSASKMKLGFKS